jgi:hypothetical protein
MALRVKKLIYGIFLLFCVLFAGYYGIKQVLDYLENEDVSRISFKQYHNEKDDKYPTFSICISPNEENIDTLYQADKIMQTLHIDEDIYFGMLSGDPLGKPNFSKLEFDDAKWDLKLVLKSYGAFGHKVHTLSYWDDELYEVNDLSLIPFHSGYQNPGRLCITRDDIFYPYKTIKYEEVQIDPENWLGDMYVYVHYPGQLMSVMEGDAKMTIDLSKQDEIGINYFTFEVSQLQVLRKRQDSTLPCNLDIESNLDMRWRESAMNKVGCTPTYWKNMQQPKLFTANHYNDCEHSEQYLNFSDLFFNEVNHLEYEPSCTHSTLIGNMLSKDHKEHPNISYVHFRINYDSEYYLEVKNVRAVRVDDLWSQIGGVIGIFLGYSILQIPYSFFNLVTFIRDSLSHPRLNVE